MNPADIFEPRKTIQLIDYNNKFDFLKNLVLDNKLPNVLMLSGAKGIGKLTLINHFMHYYFDQGNYDLNKKIFKKSQFHEQFLNDVFSNIIFLSGSNYANIKIENIKIFKDKLLKSSIINKKRFIILDDVENFNIQSLNALLKLTEEPGKNNYFLLINNKSKTLPETIKSRCLEIKVVLSQNQVNNILVFLEKYFNQKIDLDRQLLIPHLDCY